MTVSTKVRCDHDECARTLPIEGKHEWSSLRYKAEGQQWDISDEGDFCPLHKPGAEPVRLWAVKHPTVHISVHHTAFAALYTLSKLPGGVLVTRMSNEAEWQRETDCCCGASMTDAHYVGCPADAEAVSR